MRGIAYSVVVLVLAGYLGAADAAGQVAGPNSEQTAAPQEPAAVKEPATTQPTIVRSGPEPAPAVAPFDAEQAKRHQEAWAAASRCSGRSDQLDRHETGADPAGRVRDGVAGV